MAFEMKKRSIIRGSKEHSALLATESTRTHGGDPALIEAARIYGESNSPDVIDWQLTMKDIDIENSVKRKKKEKEEKIDNGEDIVEEEIVEEGSGLTDSENQADIDANVADNKLREKQEEIIISKPIVQQIGGRRILEDLYQEGVIKESYNTEEQERLVFWEDGGILVLPEELEKLEEIELEDRPTTNIAKVKKD